MDAPDLVVAVACGGSGVWSPDRERGPALAAAPGLLVARLPNAPLAALRAREEDLLDVGAEAPAAVAS